MSDNNIQGRPLIIPTSDGNYTAKPENGKVTLTKPDGSVAAIEMNEFKNWLIQNAPKINSGQPKKDSFVKSA